jgi:hypothetical protein
MCIAIKLCSVVSQVVCVVACMAPPKLEILTSWLVVCVVKYLMVCWFIHRPCAYVFTLGAFLKLLTQSIVNAGF